MRHFPVKPCFRQTLLASDGGGRNAEGLCRFFDTASAKEAQLHHFRLALVECRERIQCVVEFLDVAATLGGETHGVSMRIISNPLPRLKLWRRRA